MAVNTKKSANSKRKTTVKSSVKKPTRSRKSKSSGATKATKRTQVTKATASRTKVPESQSAAKGKKKQAVAALIDRRRSGERRATPDRRVNQAPVATERRKLQRRAAVSRRRQIDPTTCERDYTSEEIAFMTALDEYKRKSGRMFPTCSEVLEVIRDLGYVKAANGTPAPSLATDTQELDVPVGSQA